MACADVLILNKVDLVAEAQCSDLPRAKVMLVAFQADRARAAAMLREINPTARLCCASLRCLSPRCVMLIVAGIGGCWKAALQKCSMLRL